MSAGLLFWVGESDSLDFQPPVDRLGLPDDGIKVIRPDSGYIVSVNNTLLLMQAFDRLVLGYGLDGEGGGLLMSLRISIHRAGRTRPVTDYNSIRMVTDTAIYRIFC